MKTADIRFPIIRVQHSHINILETGEKQKNNCIYVLNRRRKNNSTVYFSGGIQKTKSKSKNILVMQPSGQACHARCII
jgi:hypothetical protein